MDKKGLFKKYYSRLVKEGIFKGLLLGLIAGLAVSSVFAVLAFFTNGFSSASNFHLAIPRVILISVGVLLLVTAGATVGFYFLFFTPKTKQILSRVDRLGLDERLITMGELEEDESYIAMLQREDAKEKLSRVNPKSLKIAFFTVVPFVFICLLAAFSLSMIIASASSVDKPVYWDIGEEREVLEEPDPDPDPVLKYWTVQYIIYMGSGYIEGGEFQIVVDGEDATPIVATPNPGYAFSGWLVFDDPKEEKNPRRQEKDVRADYVNFARFDPMDEGDGDDPNEEPDEQPKQDPEEEDPTDPFDPNRIIDGTVYYREKDVWAEYYAKQREILASGGEDILMELQDLINAYFESIK